MTFYPGVLTAQDITLPVPVADGGTGSATAAAALTALGAAPSASPEFTGSQPTFTTAEGLGLTAVGSQPSLTTPVSLTDTNPHTVASISVPENDPAAGSVYRIRCYGYFTTDSTSAAVTLTLLWGSTSLCSQVANPQASVTDGFWDLEAVVTFVTASTCNAVMRYFHNTAVSPAYATNINLPGSGTSAVTVTVASGQSLILEAQLANTTHVSAWVAIGSVAERVW